MEPLKSEGSWKAHLHHKSALYQAEHCISFNVSGKWVVFHLQVPRAGPCWTEIGLALDGKLFQGFYSLQTRVSRPERTLLVSLRSQSSYGSDLSRTFQGCWFVTILINPYRTYLYPLHLSITTKHFPCKEEPPSFPYPCALRYVPKRHRSFKCVFLKDVDTISMRQFSQLSLVSAPFKSSQMPHNQTEKSNLVFWD